jgi:formylmethanofuran dehydrogenase subunit C
MTGRKSLHAKRPDSPAGERTGGKSRFARYGIEHDARIRKASSKADRRMEGVLEALDGYLRFQKRLGWAFNVSDYYDDGRMLVNFACESLAEVTVSPKDVEKFSLIAPRLVRAGFPESHLAPFLNGLMEMASLQRIRLHSVHGLFEVGTDNDRIIEITGDVGRMAGGGMKRGLIHVKGSVGESAGSDMDGGTLLVDSHAEAELGSAMAGGLIHIRGDAGILCGPGMGTAKVKHTEEPLIIIDGNAGDRLGSGMKGGAIIVAGNAGEKVGEGMEGGCIYVKGSLRSLAKNIKDGYIQLGSDRIIYDGGYCDKKKG